MKKQISLCLLLTMLSGAGFSQTDIEFTYSSFLGGEGEDSGIKIELSGSDESTYLLYGNTNSGDLPVTNDAFQSNPQGFISTYLASFSIEGEFEYGSYLGGSLVENVSAISSGVNGRIILTGSTSSTDFPLLNASNDSFSVSSGFITCFSSEFDLVWSTYFGGSETDGISAIRVDSEGSIYVAGGTTSPNLGTFGVHTEEPHPASTSNGFISKLNSDGEILWYSYISGTGSSAADELQLSPDGSTIYVSGTVEGNTDHGFVNSFQAEPGGGGRDCILLAYSTIDGTMDWGTYYGGEGFDNNSNVNVLENGDVLLTGTTNSDTGISTDGSYQSVRMGSNDHFLTSFSPQGERNWSTYFGGSGMELISEINVTENRLYLSGGTFSTDGISLGNPVLGDIPSASNVVSYMARFDEFGFPLWATFLNENYECASVGRFSIAQSGNIYGVGVFNSNGNDLSCLEYISADAFQPFYGGGDSDFGIFHYQENFLSTTFPRAEPLSIYPNPAQDRVTMEAPNLLWAGMQLTITDISGRQVDRVALFQSGNTYSTGHLSEGVYILTGQIGERMFRQKLVVQR